MTTPSAYFVPESVVAGSVPAASGHPRHESVENDVQARIQGEVFQASFVEVDGIFHYVAADAQLFAGAAGEGRLLNPLSIALPGAPGHRGPGMYLARRGGTDLAVGVALLADGTLRTYSDSIARLTELASNEDLRVFRAESPESAMPWQSFQALERREARRTVRFALGALTVLFALSSAAALAAHLARGYWQPRAVATAEQVRQALASAANKANEALANPSYPALDMQERLERVVAPYYGDRARVVYFKYDDKGLSYEFTLPSYVAPEHYAVMSPTSVVREANMLRISKRPQ